MDIKTLISRYAELQINLWRYRVAWLRWYRDFPNAVELIVSNVDAYSRQIIYMRYFTLEPLPEEFSVPDKYKIYVDIKELIQKQWEG